MNKLLTRDQFREQVFARDKYKCVVCGLPAIDAHHIIERRLFDDGGYYIDNGASVCSDCHMKCEQTLITCDQLREKLGITRPVLPPHFYEDTVYDKWGNIIMPDGSRLRGELFGDESVQKALQPVLGEFSKYVKYSRTFHLPWSPGMTDDDRMMTDVDVFEGRKVVVMEKLDGENTSMYNDHIHARSVTSGGHPSRNWIRAFHGRIQADIPPMWRINVENMFAKHSILYKDLDTYAYGFAIWDEKNHILDWTTTLEWFQMLGIIPCPVIYWDIYDRKKIEDAYAAYKAKREAGGGQTEGYVIRIDEPFPFSQFKYNVGKYVRKGHVTTTTHWMYGQPVVPNTLKEGLTGFETVT
jgi:RNA ligase